MTVLLVFTFALVVPAIGQGPYDGPFPPVMPESLDGALRGSSTDSSRGVVGPFLAGPPRVSGLSIVVQDIQPSGAGRQVDLDIELSTDRLVFDSFSTSYVLNQVGTVQGQYAGVVGTFNIAFAGGESIGGYPSLGRVSTTRTVNGSRTLAGTFRTAYELTPPRGLADGTTAPFTGSDVNRNSQFGLQATVNLQTTGPLPGIDFGDGATSATVPMTELVSSMTVDTQTNTYVPLGTPRVVRTFYRRSGLSHTYADLTPRTIRAVSGCCAAGDGPGGTVETVVGGTFNAVGMTSSASTTTRRALSGSFQFDSVSVQGFSSTSSASPVMQSDSTMDTNMISPTLGIYPVPLKTATADIGGVLEIPVAGSLGMGVLAVVLAGLGLFLLRRSL